MMTSTITQPTVDSFVQTIQIKVPPSTKWEPQRVQQFIDTLYALQVPVILSIRATMEGITWWVDIGKPSVNTVVSSLHTLYSEAELSVVPKKRIDVGYYAFYIDTANPFILPLKSVFQHKEDPLKILIGAFPNLKPDEELVYELALSKTQTKYYELGEKLMTGSNISQMEFTSVEGALGALNRKRAGLDEVSVLPADIERDATEKLRKSLQEVTIVIKVKAASKTIADELFDSIIYQTTVFDYGFQGLCVSRGDSHLPVLTSEEVASLWHPRTSDIGDIEPPDLSKTKGEGVVLGTTEFRGNQMEIKLADADRSTHMSIFGSSGLGKSTLFHNMLYQDIVEGKGLALVDPHGDLFKEILAVTPEHRYQDVVIFDVSDTEYPVGLNLFAQQTGVRQEQASSEIFNVIRKILSDDLTSARMRDVMRNSIAALVDYEGATIKDVPRLLNNSEFRGQVMGQIRNRVTKEYWIDEFETFTASRKTEIAMPINSRLREFYRNPDIERILCQQSSLDFRKLMDDGKIFFANLGGLQDIEREVIGALLISKIQMAAMSRGEIEKSQREMFYLYIDEVQNFVTTSLPTILSEARKYGLSLITANQFLAQLEGDTLNAIMANVGTSVIFGVGVDDARVLENYVQPEVDRAQLMNQGRGQTTIRTKSGGNVVRAFRMRTLPPLDIPESSYETVTYLRNQSRTRYARHRDDVERELDERFATSAKSINSGQSDEGQMDDDKFAN